jgi:hypothetical protein
MARNVHYHGNPGEPELFFYFFKCVWFVLDLLNSVKFKESCSVIPEIVEVLGLAFGGSKMQLIAMRIQIYFLNVHYSLLKIH